MSDYYGWYRCRCNTRIIKIEQDKHLGGETVCCPTCNLYWNADYSITDPETFPQIVFFPIDANTFEPAAWRNDSPWNPADRVVDIIIMVFLALLVWKIMI